AWVGARRLAFSGFEKGLFGALELVLMEEARTEQQVAFCASTEGEGFAEEGLGFGGPLRLETNAGQGGPGERAARGITVHLRQTGFGSLQITVLVEPDAALQDVLVACHEVLLFRTGYTRDRGTKHLSEG